MVKIFAKAGYFDYQKILKQQSDLINKIESHKNELKELQLQRAKVNSELQSIKGQVDLEVTKLELTKQKNQFLENKLADTLKNLETEKNQHDHYKQANID